MEFFAKHRLHRPAVQYKGLRFDPSLVPSLKDDHHALIEMHRRIVAAHQARNFEACRTALRQFKRRLTDHLIVENTRLYLYVKCETSRRFQQEMNELVRGVSGFLNRYTAEDGAVQRPQFGPDLEAIGAALSDRLRREEQGLYPLYTPAG